MYLGMLYDRCHQPARLLQRPRTTYCTIPYQATIDLEVFRARTTSTCELPPSYLTWPKYNTYCTLVREDYLGSQSFPLQLQTKKTPPDRHILKESFSFESDARFALGVRMKLATLLDWMHHAQYHGDSRKEK